jgi:gamma-glutamyltranspeptidase/glutathione hydrolase
VLEFEGRFDPKTVAAMAATGYKVSQKGKADGTDPGIWGNSEIIAVDPKNGSLYGADDPRFTYGKAAGY